MNKLMEMAGYVGIALTVCGQVVVNFSAMWGQIIWLVANALFLAKAVNQNMGKAEISRNMIMLGVTIGLIILNIFK